MQSPQLNGAERLPLVDPEVLEDLEDQLGGPALAVRFAHDYAALWGQRYSRLDAAVKGVDRKDALDAILSLKTTSSMVGGLRLAQLAEIVEKAIRQDDFVHCQSLMEQIARDGEQTVSELQATYILPPEL